MEDKQYPKLENNNSNSTIIGSSGLDSAQISKEPALESYTVKIGAVLEAEDLAFCNMSERTLILPILSDIYGISFVVDCVGRSDSPSFTSKKAIINTEHARYFLKQKAEYCSNTESLLGAATFQTFLSEKTNFVPEIVKTRENEFYGFVGPRIYLLTPLVEGSSFSGPIAQSISCARNLALLHCISASFDRRPAQIISSEKEALKFVDWFKKLSCSDEFFLVLLANEMTSEITSLDTSATDGRYQWLHGDYAPFNVIFDKNEVTAINDFDNCGLGPLVRDVSYCLLTHCAIYYLANTSSFNRPINTSLDIERMRAMLTAYVIVNPLSSNELKEVGKQAAVQWLEMMGLGIMRGDFEVRDVLSVLPFARVIREEINKMIDERFLKMNTDLKLSIWAMPEIDRQVLENKWKANLSQVYTENEIELENFFEDHDKGFEHSFNVMSRAREIVGILIERGYVLPFNKEAVEQLSIFHDIGKYFQAVPSFDNLRVSQNLYKRFVEHFRIGKEIAVIVNDGIPGTDFYCSRLNPNEKAPLFFEGDIVRAADKTLDNLVGKVDRYWFEYGVPRKAVFFDPLLTYEDRINFNFGNFQGDQLNVILTILALKADEFQFKAIGQIYEEWADSRKELVVERILSLASEVAPNFRADIKATVEWYRKEFNC